MVQNRLKKIQVAIIIFALISILAGIYFLFVSSNVHSLYTNDEFSNEVANYLKDNDFDSNEVSNYEAQLKNNGIELSTLVKSYSGMFATIFMWYFILVILLNVLTIVFSILVSKRSSDKTNIFFATKYSVMTLVFSFVSLNLVNVVLSIFSIITIRKIQFSLV